MFIEHYYRRSGVSALWLYAFLFFTALLILRAILPEGWTFISPAGSFWIATTTLALGAVGLLITGKLTGGQDLEEDRYVEYTLEERESAPAVLAFTPTWATLDQDAYRHGWYPLWPGPEGKQVPKSIYPPELREQLGWKAELTMESFIQLNEVRSAEEEDRGLQLDMKACWQRLRVPKRWPGAARLREDLEAWEAADTVERPFARYDEDDTHLTIINRASNTPAKVTIRSDVYGYDRLRSGLVTRLRAHGVSVACRQLPRRSVLGPLSVLLCLVSLIAFVTQPDELLRSFFVASFAVFAPVMLTANHRHLSWMRLRWELGITLLVPLLLLYLNEALHTQ